ncbi:hypothetical protein UPYG_G00198150 [Umbra pygmaea]|uniref:[histone H3]-lysine(4) N-methyltransferase n=1 Tax=Umbra pygmaea TaxID=75934 RepID=A0ABD0WHL4_UMBPY
MAVIRGKQLRCENCQRPGATVGCCLTSCTSNYHFMCARQRHCVFLEDKKVYCQRHRDLIKGEVVSGFEVTRRILVDLEGISLRRKFLNGLEPENVHLMIGSMTIDCLGLLTELSDCKHKLFPIGYQCSRVYWSTLDARKRCVYTCRILVCRPAVLEPDLKSALTEENRTISHSPPPSPDKALSPVPDPFDSPTPSDRQSLLPSSPQPTKVYTRNRHPSYPPCQHSPGSRPLPSPGGSSQSVHEIVTVGDPLLNSGLKSIGSRRHSTSSISPQPRQKIDSPPQAESASAINQLALLSSTAGLPLSLSVSRELSLRDTEKGVPSANIRTQSRSAHSLGPGSQQSRHHYSMAEKKADTGKESMPGKQAVGENTKLAAMSPGMRGASQASPQPGTAVLTVHQRGSNSQSEKGKQGGKDTDLSAGITVFSRHRVTTTLTKDRVNSHSAKEGNTASTPVFKDAGKSGSPQPRFHKSSGRKSQDYLSGPASATAMKLLWSSGSSAEEEVIKRSSQSSPAVPSTHGTSTKDKHSKVRNIGSREASKEREKTHQNSSKSPMLNNNNPQHEGTGGFTHAHTPATQDSSSSKTVTLSSSNKSAALGGSSSNSNKSAAFGGSSSSNKLAAFGGGSSNKSASLGGSSSSSNKSASLGGSSSNKSASLGGGSSSNKSASLSGGSNKSAALGGGSNKSAALGGGSSKSTTLGGGTSKSATLGGCSSKSAALGGSSSKSAALGGGGSSSKSAALGGGSIKSAAHGGSSIKSAAHGGSSIKSAALGGGSSIKSATLGGGSKSTTLSSSSKSTSLCSSKSASLGSSNKSMTLSSGKSVTIGTGKSMTLGNNTKASGKVDGEKLESQGRGERSSKNNEMFSSPEKTIRSSLEVNPQAKLVSERSLRPSQVQAKATACEFAAAKDKKRAIGKASLIPLKADPNGTTTVGTSSDSNSTTSICPSSKGRPPNCRSPPSASSESSESDSLPQHSLDCRDEQLLPHCTEDEGTSDRDDHALLEDEGGDVDKHHEDDSDGSGSAKRRYPRRSARARSNMFFGLTPFYGVRSYGEEDIPLYSSSGDGHSKRRAGGSRRSAEGQVDGADDMSTSSSGDSGAEEEGRNNQCSNKDPYYYNFTRTIINPGPGLPSIEGIDQCLGRSSQLQRYLKDEEEEEERVAAVGNEGVATLSLLGHQQIGQLDGVDDSSESDASASTTTTATTASSHKSTGKRKGRDRHVEKLEHDSGKEADGSSGGGGSAGTSSNTRDSRKSQKDSSLPLVVVKSSQGHDPLEAQLSLSTDLLKSDSDNNNSDDCGNILPSDIMEFVLNTPSMQALGQQPETASSELLSLDEGYGVDVNRRKDILFEDFPQPLPRPEPVESGVTTSISVEEPYGLPLELPSDLSVLTTRSPTVNNQNHAALISEGAERTMLSMATSEESITEKGGEDNQLRSRASVSTETQQEGSSGSRDSQMTEGHMTPEPFERINSPALGQVVEADNQELTRSSGTPSLPRSPTLPLQGQTYIPAGASASPGPTQMTNTTVQATSHLKPGPEKLIVVNQLVNQHLQPLYVVQTLPNGVTQKIHITPSVSSTGVIDTMTLTTGLTMGMTTSQPIFPAGGKVLGSMPHHPQIHTFTSTTQTGFQSGLPSTTSGLLIGVPSHEPQILVTEAGRRHDLSPNVTIVSSTSSISTSSTVFTSGHGKKRPISRLQPRKTKKLARSRSQPTLAPSEMGPNMTLINLSSPQMSQSGLVELGTLTTAATTSHRNVPNIIKKPKSGVVTFEPTTLLQKGQLGILGHDSSTQLLPCTVSGLNPNHSAVLNVVSMAPPSRSGGLIRQGPVSLSNPVLSSAEIAGPISSLLFKASPHNLGLPEQQMVVHSGAPQMSGSVQTSIGSSICVLPSHQTISMSVSHQVDSESGAFQLQQNPVRHILADKTMPLEASTRELLAPSTVPQESGKGRLVGVLTQSLCSQSSCTTPISRSSSEQKQALKSSASSLGKGKQKAKRSRQSPDKSSGKKHKGWQAELSWEMHGECSTTTPGSREPVSTEPMDTGKPREKGTNKSIYSAKSVEPRALTSKTNEFSEEKNKTTAGSLLVATSDQEGDQRDSSLESKPKKGLIFEICSDDGFQIRCESIEEAWKSLTDKVQEARSNARLKELSFEGVNGLRMLGVLHDAVVYLLEQLYGSRHCRNYRFRFHKPEEADEPPINPHGSARAELYNRRSVFDMFNFLASKHRQPPEYNPHNEDEEEVRLKSARRATSMDLPMAMRFRHLKRTSKEAVGVYRSAIHGRGLFCKRSIDAGEMVIEYSGNVIRSVLTDKREKYYDSKGVGCYMFRIDDYEVVDATVHGNAARFINHSCEPNCYSRVINVDGQKHIVIFASRKIYRGEELTYDYKFPIEDLGNKLPCNCGAKKCRKFLN